MSAHQSKVSKIFSRQDIYLDAEHPNCEQNIEELFGNLENATTLIITRMRKAFEANEESIALTRVENNTIRKFWSLMKYCKPKTCEFFWQGVAKEFSGGRYWGLAHL